MAFGYLLDEHFRGLLWKAIEDHNTRGVDPLDVVRVGDAPDLLLGSQDETLLDWIELTGRVLVSRDKRTLPTKLAQHHHKGGHVPGIFIVRPSGNLVEVLSFLVAAAWVSEISEWQDRITFIP